MRYHSIISIITYFISFLGTNANAIHNETNNRCIVVNNAESINPMSIEEILFIKSILDTVQIPDILRTDGSILANNPYIYKYSTLLNIDSTILNRLFLSDSLFEVFVSELDKLPMNDEITYLLTKGLLECNLLVFPETLFKSFSLKKQLWLQDYYCKNKFFHISDYIFYTEYYGFVSISDGICGADTIMMEYSDHAVIQFFKRKSICVSPAIANACALHFSSEILPNGELIILINNTTYRIIKRKDGSTVLRKAD